MTRDQIVAHHMEPDACDATHRDTLTMIPAARERADHRVARYTAADLPCDFRRADALLTKLDPVVEREPARDEAGNFYTMATISGGQCRWMQDEHLCANPVADRKTPYCEFHQTAAHSRRRAA